MKTNHKPQGKRTMTIVLFFVAISTAGVFTSKFFSKVKTSRPSVEGETQNVAKQPALPPVSGRTDPAQQTSDKISSGPAPIAAPVGEKSEKDIEAARLLSEVRRRLQSDQIDELAYKLLEEAISQGPAGPKRREFSGACSKQENCAVPLTDVYARIRDRLPMDQVPAVHTMLVDAIYGSDSEVDEKVEQLTTEMKLAGPGTRSRKDPHGGSTQLSGASFVFLNAAKSILQLKPTYEVAAAAIQSGIATSQDTPTNQEALRILNRAYSKN